MLYSDDPFVQFLLGQQGKRIYLKPYWGNSGDGLIWLGNELILKALGLERVMDPRHADIILWPGGNPTMWPGNLQNWKDCWHQWPGAKFVIAPATFQGNAWQTILHAGSQNVIGVFARDPKSLENLQRANLPAKIQIGLGHDPAFHLRGSEWISPHRKAATSEYILASFRDDHESSYLPTSPDGIATVWPFTSIAVRREWRRKSEFKQHRMRRIAEANQNNQPILEVDAPLMSFEAFVECVRRASQIHTDRLHCMIMALLLEKPVFAYSTAYGKLEAVYDFSVKSWAKVTFVQF